MRIRAFVPAMVPAVLGVALLSLGHGARGWVLLGAAQLVLLLVLAGVDVQGWVVGLAQRVVWGLTVLIAGLASVAFVLPVWLLNSLRRRDPLQPEDSNGGWAPFTTVQSLPGRAFTRTLPPDAASPGRRILQVIGLVVVVLLADLGAGVAWNQVSERAGTSAAGVIRIDTPSEFDLPAEPDTPEDHPPDPRAKGAAMSDYPWAEQYFDEFHSFGSMYWPYTLYRPRPFRGQYLNVTGWERRTHRPDTIRDPMPTLAVFGGSGAFGEGQRDEYTIASQLSRIAEADRLPMNVRNFGQRGWVHWQEMTLYEQLLAAGEEFDLSLFYDGPNELTVQTEPVNGVPSHYDTEEWATRLAGRPVDGDPEPNLAASVFRWWRGRSVGYRMLLWLGSQLDTPASADDGDGRRPFSDESVADAVAVYERSRSLSRHISADHGVVDSYFWQPQKEDLPEYERAARAVSEPTVDLSHVLDAHNDTYLDAVHTNEMGARIVAEAMWATLRPKVQAWYDAQG